MGPRAAIVLAVLSSILLCGCAGDSSANYGIPDLGAASDLGIPSDSAFCGTNIDIIGNPAADASGSLYAPVDLIATGHPGTSNLDTPIWTVSYADGTTYTPEIIDQASGLTVRFHAPLPGSYTFRVHFDNVSCPGEKAVIVHTRDSKTAAYKLRFSPPSTAGVPQQDVTITVAGGTPDDKHDVTLQSGTLLQGTLRGPGGAAVAGEVRLLGDNGPDALTVAGSNGLFAVAVNNDLNYTPLLIPSGNLLAPRLLAKNSGALLSGSSFSVDAGQVVSGTVSDPSAAVIAGARVVLRAGRLPSGTGISAADGTYLLRAQPGDYVASVGADGRPELTLSAVTVPAAAQTLNVQYLVPRVAVTAKVVSSMGAAVGGARVTLRSSAVAGAATLTVGGVAQAASGRVNQVVISAADGTLPALLLPLGSYSVLIEPPASTGDGVTLLTQTLDGAATWTLATQPRIFVSGNVTNLLGSGVAGVKVTGFETAGLGAAPATQSSFDGSFSLRVDPGSPVELLFEPPASANLGSARLALPPGTTSANAALPPGLKLGGTISAPGGGKLGSVLVEALCATCGSPAPIASCISDGSGYYALYLPDPGVDTVDGGTVDLSP